MLVFTEWTASSVKNALTEAIKESAADSLTCTRVRNCNGLFLLFYPDSDKRSSHYFVRLDLSCKSRFLLEDPLLRHCFCRKIA